MNNRANIMYFIEHFCDMATKEKHIGYVRMIQRDILRVVDAVAPPDGSGAANIKVVRRVLQGLQSKSHLTPDTVTEIEACLKEREAQQLQMLGLDDVGEPMNGVIGGATGGMSGDGPGGGPNSDRADTPMGGVAAPTSRSNGLKLDKKQIEQRIEEDRERNKRLREIMWAVAGDDLEEMNQLWDETSDIGEDDFLAAEEEVMERRMMAEAL